MPDFESSRALDEEVEKLIDGKVSELRAELKAEKSKIRDLERENEDLRRRIEKRFESIKKQNSNDIAEKISRRTFLKKIGMGAAGLGALSMAPASSQLKITKNGISNIDTINEESVDQLGGGSNEELVATAEPDSSDTSALLSNPDEGNQHLRLYYYHRDESAGPFYLRFNGDGSSTGKYAYWRNDGSYYSGQDNIEILYSTTRNAHATGIIDIKSRWGVGVGHKFLPQISRISRYLSSGMRSSNTSGVSTVDLHKPAGFSGSAKMELYKVKGGLENVG